MPKTRPRPRSRPKRSGPRPRETGCPPIVTALRAASAGRVEVDLDGEPWRKLPLEVVIAAGLAAGVELGRERARRLRRELREHEALARAARALARRDLSECELAERLARARVPLGARSSALARLVGAGAVDDERLARRRAELLAERGSGDALIRADLGRRGIANHFVDSALAALEPETARARRVVGQRGASLATARQLARKGFSEDSVGEAYEKAVAEKGVSPVP